MAPRRSQSISRLPIAGLREQLAQEAARLMIESGIEDFRAAKRKAAERFGVHSAGALPSNAQIQASLEERLRIFEPDAHDHRLAQLRRLAVEVMEYLAPFQPRLAGSVLTGSATINSPIELHVFTDSPELVAAMLEKRGIGARDTQRRYRFGGQRTADVPGFSFARAGEVIQIMTFPENGAREAPLSPIDQRPMRRAGRAEVLALLEV
ncbi:MAG TPA: hypothetical protein VJA26_14180 [Gammaproteobacteria bacterium]|nr:hypothetical protein [Gammaproteobacteria bacterium]